MSEELALPAGIAVAVLYGGDPVAGLAATLGCLAGQWLSPDLDLAQLTRSEHRALRRSLPLGIIWVALWYPYARIIPYHRSPLSHAPILGTVLRLLYLTTVVALLLTLVGVGYVVPGLIEAIFSPYGRASIIGLMVSDSGHRLMDIPAIEAAVRAFWRMWDKI